MDKPKRLVLSGLLMLTLSIVLWVGYKYISLHAASAAWNNQKWGEISDPPKVVVLKPGEWMRFGPFQATVGAALHYDVNASLPVSTGLVVPGGTWPGGAACFEKQVLSSSKSCRVSPRSGLGYIFVFDTRKAGEMPGGARLGNKQVIPDNRVSITTYHWGCVSDCVK
jgi:hypothetical protein